MTTKILTGTYSAGYTLSPSYAGLLVTASAEVDGVGVIAGAPAKVTNQGRILAAAGAAGGVGHYQGGLGSTGIDLAAGGRLVNAGTVAGGDGGAGAYDLASRTAYDGGAGGAVIVFSAAGRVVNFATVTGGDGGAGGGGPVAR
jgi:hypothetical protein